MKTIVLALCMMAAAGCAVNKEPAPAAGKSPDEVIGQEVRYRIATQCPADAPAIRIVVSSGVVALQGRASSQAAAWRAQAAATAVPGVKNVRNELFVSP